MVNCAAFTDFSPLNGAAGIILHLTRYVVVSPVGRARSELRMENTQRIEMTQVSISDNLRIAEPKKGSKKAAFLCPKQI